MSLSVVLLDLDDTLIDRTGAFAAALRERLGAKLAPDKLEAVLPELLLLDDRGRRERPEFWRAAIGKAPALGWDPKELQAWGAPAIAERIQPDPQVRAALEALRGRGLTLGLVTNGAGKHQREKLERAGLADLFQTIVISSEVGVRKPDPAIFLRALEQLGVGPGAALHVGDDPERDVEAARRAGLSAAWVEREAWPGELAPAALVLRQVTELPARLAEMS